MPKRTIKFKTEGGSINIGGRTIRQCDITPELYDELVAIAPAHADLFDVTEEKEKPAKEEKPAKPEKE